jgi:hypothetical protein
MSSLRRDLFERRLWLVAALLLAAIIAVPMLLLKSALADGTPTPPPPHLTILSARAVPDARTVPVKLPVVRIPRNPFASGMPKLSAKPPSTTPAGGTSSSTTTTSGAMVSPSPPAASTQSASTTSTTSTTAKTAPSGTAAVVRSWTMYSVSLRYGKHTSARVQNNVARLTPLPSVKQPAVMFTGVMSGGQQAVFALGAGVWHQGPGLCRPDRKRCAAIVLRARQTEVLTITTAEGRHQQRKLRLVDIARSTTHSESVARAAYDRHSAAGRCELELADPLSYSQAKGTLSRLAGGACHNQPVAVPFPYPVVAP